MESKLNCKLILAICVANLCALADSRAIAATIQYTMNNVNFEAPPLPSGGVVSDSFSVGTFNYDTVSQIISNISIVTTNTPGTIFCYENCSGTNIAVLGYTGSNYISSIPGQSGGATAQVILDPANPNNQQIVFFSNSNGGGSVYAPGGRTSSPCNANYRGGCVLSLTIPKNSLNAGKNIQLASDSLIGAQTTPGSADPQGNPVCAVESWATNTGSSFVRYSFAPCGSLTTPNGAGGGLPGVTTFALLFAAYTLARVWLRRRAASV
jgi:hypothetical protein